MTKTERCGDATMRPEPTAPDFERIIARLGSLVARLRSVRETSVFISDALIGVQNTGPGLDDCAKPSSPDYFVIKCFDLIGEFDEEIEHLEVVNETLVNSVKSM